MSAKWHDSCQEQVKSMKSKTSGKKKPKKRGLESLGYYKTYKAVYLEAYWVARWHNGVQVLELPGPVYIMTHIIFLIGRKQQW